MQKHHKKKLLLARSTIRILGSVDAIAGGVSGTRGRNTVDNVCGPGGSDGATCNDTSQENCGTGVVSHCLCTTHATEE